MLVEAPSTGRRASASCRRDTEISPSVNVIATKSDQRAAGRFNHAPGRSKRHEPSQNAPTDGLFSSKLPADLCVPLGSQTAMRVVLQIVAVLAFLVALALLAEVTWGVIRLRRLHQGVDI